MQRTSSSARLLQIIACLVFHCVIAMAMLFAAPARAEVTSSVLLKGGTLGFGPELDLRLARSSFGLRIDADGVGFADDDIANCRFRYAEAAYGYDAKVRLGGAVRLLNGGVTADYYPFGDGFRLSGGVVINGNEVTAHGVPTGQLRIGAATIAGTLPGRVDASATFNAVAPVIGVGYTALLSRHLRLSADLGAMYEGDPHLSYRLTGFPPLPSIAANAESERERLQRLLNYPVYPVAMIGLGWQF